jgi:putative ABC transport system permease protein
MRRARSFAVAAAILSHWRRHPLQLLTLVLGLALATALWSGVQAINAEARAAYARAATTLGQDRLDRLLPAPGEVLTLPDLAALRLHLSRGRVA